MPGKAVAGAVRVGVSIDCLGGSNSEHGELGERSLEDWSIVPGLVVSRSWEQQFPKAVEVQQERASS